MTNPRVGDQYRSNRGLGPYMARIVAIDDDVAHMERWHTKQSARRTEFDLQVSYLRSAACGWVLAHPAQESKA